MNATHAPLYLGLISGTSADAVDVALVAFEPALTLVAHATHAYPPALRARILDLSQAEARITLDELGELDVAIGEAFGDAARELVDAGAGRAIRAIGSHGQTLRHRPSGAHPYTVQLGDPNVIAERTGLTTIADFRRRDVAAGGQGAPLMPAFHAAMLAQAGEPRAVLNLGGIANLTLLHGDATPVFGFDTGPANALLDAWALRHRGTAHDENGAWAASGRVDPILLDAWLSDPYFAAPPPKSTGRDQFHLAWAEQSPRLHALDPADVQATLAELTARTVADALRRAMPHARRLVGCGGGVHNAHVMARLAALLPGIVVENSAAHGLAPDHVEAMGFAWLARETLEGRPGNLPSVTGARGLRVLGAIYSA